MEFLRPCFKPMYYYRFDELLDTGGEDSFAPAEILYGWVAKAYGWGYSWASTDSPYFHQLEEISWRITRLFNRPNAYFYMSENYYENPSNSQELTNEARWKIQDLVRTLYETMDLYGKLIQLQQQNIDSIMNDIRVSSNNTIRYNDTPQSQGAYAGSDYTSTITTTNNEVTTPIGPLADKLESARRALNDIYEDWLQVFKRFVIYA